MSSTGIELSADPVLFLLEQVERQRICIVGLEEPLLFSFELLSLAPELITFPLCVAAHLGYLCHQELFDLDAVFAGDDQPVVALCHPTFYLLDQHRLL